MPGYLELIETRTISAATSAVDIDNVFSEKYDVYKITTANISTVGTTNTDVDMRLLDSTGTVIDQSEYAYAEQILRTNTGFGPRVSNSATSLSQFFGGTDNHPESMGAIAYVFQPFDSNSFTFFTSQVSYAVASVRRGFKNIGVHKSAESCRGFRIFTSQNFDEGVINVYGVK